MNTFIVPVAAPYKVTVSYGERYRFGIHTGTDIINTGSPRQRGLIAPQSGTVTVKKTFGKGNVVLIDNGMYKSELAHLSTVGVVSGQSIKVGDYVGVYGSTGAFTTGPHLHWELFEKGVRKDAMKFVGKPFKQEDYMQDFWPAIEDAYWEILWRGITDAERSALNRSSQNKAAYDRQTDNMWKSEERRKALELAYKNEINRTGKEGYGKEWVDFQFDRRTQMSRAIKDLVDRKKEIKDSYKK